jgi:hypothetical protein
MSYSAPIVAVGASTGFTAETAMVTSPLVAATPVGGQGNLISGNLTFTGNASASTVTIKVRQGSGTGGTTVYTSPAITVAAAAVMDIPFFALDATAASAGVSQYTVTATASGAATAGIATVVIQNAAEQD